MASAPYFASASNGSTALPLDFRHLLAVFVLYQPRDNDILIGRLVENQRGDSQQRIEPASGLIHGFGNKIRRKLLLEQLLVFKGIMVLCKGMAPESNQQSMTSGTRFICLPQCGHLMVTASIYGRCSSILSGQLSDMDLSSSMLPTEWR